MRSPSWSSDRVLSRSRPRYRSRQGASEIRVALEGEYHDKRNYREHDGGGSSTARHLQTLREEVADKAPGNIQPRSPTTDCTPRMTGRGKARQPGRGAASLRVRGSPRPSGAHRQRSRRRRALRDRDRTERFQRLNGDRQPVNGPATMYSNPAGAAQPSARGRSPRSARRRSAPGRRMATAPASSRRTSLTGGD